METNNEKYGLNVYHVSDTHGYHGDLKIPDNVDVMIHSGDATNYRDVSLNHHEFENFVDWYESVNVPIKIYVAGNHDAMLNMVRKDSERRLRDAGIEYLNKESLTIYGCKFYGDPTTPSYGNWHFMADRTKIQKHWKLIPDDTNVLITHGPPKGILDLTTDTQRNLLQVGDKSLANRINEIETIKYHLFGHIHNCENVVNTGTRTIGNVVYSNAAAVEDRKFHKGVIFNGNIFEI